MPSDPLEALDAQFVEIYEQSRRRLLEQQMGRGLIVINEDDLLLYYGDQQPRVYSGLRPPLYNKLKSLGHVPMAIFSLLAGADDDDPLPAETLAALRAYRGQLSDTAPALELSEHEGPEVTIFARSLAFLDQALAHGRVSGAELEAYGRAAAADLPVLFYGATKVQLEACHRHMMEIKTQVMSAEDWPALRVLVLGPALARNEQNFLQYFSRILDVPLHGDPRLVYYEGQDQELALELMATVLLDYAASETIFGDAERLARDVLADETTGFLQELLP